MKESADASAGAVERLWILWSGFHDGSDYARRHPATNPYLDADQVVRTAALACERKRRVSAPFDQTIVHSAYTHGWMAGYLATQRELRYVAEGLSPCDAANIIDSLRTTRADL